MPRDHRRLRVFQLADKLILDVYRVTSTFPESERYGLQGQLRRAAVSVAVNVVEGCARRTEGDFCRFIDVAFGSSRECCYAISIAARLSFLEATEAALLEQQYNDVCAQLLQLRRSFRPD